MVVAPAFQTAEGVVKNSFFAPQFSGLIKPGYGSGVHTTKVDQRIWRCSYTDDSLVDADKNLSQRKHSKKVRKNSQKAAAAVVAAEETSTLCSDELVLKNNLSALLEAAYLQPAAEPLVTCPVEGFTSKPSGMDGMDGMGGMGGMDSAQPLVYRYKKTPRLGLESRAALHRARVERLMKARQVDKQKHIISSVGDESDIWSPEADALIKEHISNMNISLLDWEKLPVRCLSPAEELRLASYMLPARTFQQIKMELSEHAGRELSVEEWAGAAKTTVPTLTRYLEVAQAARQKMIKHNLRLVAFQARKYFKEELSLSLVDLCQEGVPGLVRAVDKFDPRKGFRFSTYAVYWIKNSILRAQTRLGHLIRVPYNVAVQKMLIYRLRAELSRKLAREPTHQEVIKEMNMESRRYFHVLQTGAPRWSLNARSKVSGEELIQQLAETDDTSATHYLRAGARLRDGVEDLLESLKPKERLVIRQRYGLDGKGERSLSEIGRNLNLSREMVRKYEIRGMMKLRHPARIKYLRDFLL